jgi:hypothetical protein
MAARVERRGVRGGDHALATAAILIQIFLSPFERRQSVPEVQAGRHTGGIPSVWAWHAPAVKLQTQRTKEKARESRQERDAVRPVMRPAMRPAIEAHFRSPTRPTSGVRLVCHNSPLFPGQPRLRKREAVCQGSRGLQQCSSTLERLKSWMHLCWFRSNASAGNSAAFPHSYPECLVCLRRANACATRCAAAQRRGRRRRPNTQVQRWRASRLPWWKPAIVSYFL